MQITVPSSAQMKKSILLPQLGGQQPTEDGLDSSCVMSLSGRPERCDVFFYTV